MRTTLPALPAIGPGLCLLMGLCLGPGLVPGAAPSAAAADTIEVDTVRGPSTVPAMPETIAVFDIAALDSLTALGIAVAGVPDTLYLAHLREALADAVPVGTLFEPDYEALYALQPDLVIAGGRSSPKLGALSELAPAIDMTIWGDDLLPQARDRIRTYGRIFGRQDEAESLIGELDGALQSVRAGAKDRGRALIVLTNGPKISVYGPGSRFGWLHTELGLEPAATGLDGAVHGQAVSFEFIRDADPDWLLVIDRAAAIGAEGEGAAETLDNALVAETSAWKSGQVVYLDAAGIYIAAGGYTALRGILADLAAAFDASE